jgi:hypothetical protein
MSEITSVTRRERPARASGTDLSEVRRPPGEAAKRAAAVEPKKAKKPKASDG